MKEMEGEGERDLDSGEKQRRGGRAENTTKNEVRMEELEGVSKLNGKNDAEVEIVAEKRGKNISDHPSGRFGSEGALN